MDIIEAIKTRRTTRRFIEEDIDKAITNRLEMAQEGFAELIAKDVKIIPFLNKENLSRVFKKALGDYGKLFNAPLYYAVATNRNYKDGLVNAGFIGEQFILELTKEGLSSCWIVPPSGNRMLDARLKLDDEEVIIALIAGGYPAKDFQSNLVNKIMGKASSSRKKLSKLVYKDNFKTSAKEADLKEAGVYEALDTARFAPSWHNVQPWFFLIKDGVLHLILNFDGNRYKKRIAAERLHYHKIDMGIMMATLSVIRKHEGKTCDWVILSEGKTGDYKKEFLIKDGKGLPFAYFKL